MERFETTVRIMMETVKWRRGRVNARRCNGVRSRNQILILTLLRYCSVLEVYARLFTTQDLTVQPHLNFHYIYNFMFHPLLFTTRIWPSFFEPAISCVFSSLETHFEFLSQIAITEGWMWNINEASAEDKTKKIYIQELTLRFICWLYTVCWFWRNYHTIPTRASLFRKSQWV